GDIPIGISYYSADVFFERESFDLEWCGGAPPQTAFKDDAITPDDTEEQYAHNLVCGNKYLKAVQETAGASEVLGEDLGAVPHYGAHTSSPSASPAQINFATLFRNLRHA
ncbi:4-alpha-glucanotransferase, partial [Akkermansiaceae bacterium]|nr:4-alpha-glucanotransferase [Akkermansiaceae bacterium]